MIELTEKQIIRSEEGVRAVCVRENCSAELKETFEDWYRGRHVFYRFRCSACGQEYRFFDEKALNDCVEDILVGGIV
jgi:hypothetical protein